MVRDIVTYPDKRINITAPDVRSFDEELAEVLRDIKDTLNKHGAKGMAAIQIALPYAVVVVKQDDGSYLEIINPRIIGKEGSVTSTESTLYFPNTTHTVNRYEKIRLIYQDRDGKQKSLIAKGELSILLQRKIDYVYGATIANRVSEKERKDIEKNLAKNGAVGSFESCPRVFMRDYFISFIQKILFFMTLTLFTPLFDFKKETFASIYSFDKYAYFTLIALLAGYFATALYESKKYHSCTSCQIGNIIGTTIKYLAAASVIFWLCWYIISRS